LTVVLEKGVVLRFWWCI